MKGRMNMEKQNTSAPVSVGKQDKGEVLPATPVVANPMVAGVLLAPAAISLMEKLLGQAGY
jgi:hypothetical protein